MRRGDKPVNIEVAEPVKIEALDLDAQGIGRLAPSQAEAVRCFSLKALSQLSW